METIQPHLKAFCQEILKILSGNSENNDGMTKLLLYQRKSCTQRT